MRFFQSFRRGVDLPASCGALLVLLLLIAPASCQSMAASPNEEILVLEVAPETVTCQGEAVQECLRVRAPSEEDWRNFYDSIEGFTHEPGHRYLIEVVRRRVENPLADASGFSYRLLEILDEEPVEDQEPVDG